MRPSQPREPYTFQKKPQHAQSFKSPSQSTAPGDLQMNSVMVQRMIQKPNPPYNPNSTKNGEGVKRTSLFKDSFQNKQTGSNLNLNFMKGITTTDKLTK